MDEIRQQDIVWVKFPYSDLSEGKFRPAVVVSNNAYNKERPDIVVCGVTSRLDKNEYSIVIGDSNIASGKLAVRSMVRADKIQLIEKALIAKTFARLDDKTFDLIVAELTKLVKRHEG